MNAQVQERIQTYAADAAFVGIAQEKFTELLGRSATDRTFRHKLLTDPRAAIADFAGRDPVTISNDLNVVFVENTADATIVLPNLIANAADLSEDELETVAGGTTTLPCTAALASALWVAAEVINYFKSDSGCDCC